MKRALIVMALMPLIASASLTEYPPIAQDKVFFETDDTFHFGFDHDFVLYGDEMYAGQRIVEISQYLVDNPTKIVRIEGFADETGTYTYNMDLSFRRANEVATRLKAHGVRDSQIQLVFYSEMDRLVYGHHDKDWAANRRARMRIISSK